MNQQFDTEDSINSDEAIKSIECKYLTPNFHPNLDDKGTSVHKRMNAINQLRCKFKESLVSKDEVFTQSSPFKSTNVISSQNGLPQSEFPSSTLKAEVLTKQDKVHLADSRKRHNTKNSIEQFQEKQIKQNHRKSQPHLQPNLIQTRKPKRQIFVTQIVNDHCEITSFPFPKPQRLSRIIQNNDGYHSQRGSSTSTPRGILKSGSFEVLRIGSRPSTQSLNSPMMRPSSKKVSFEFTSEQLRKMKNNNGNSDHNKYQRLKTKFKK
ncbi:unnamed protein product [Paramecium pentaurelia]|uniref:Uncharacterized protein n=1 Tax=Paramecium pentaurelia TaxID=43138 RepID=A0A8S1VWF1_9CILI|nr:unnamed protein product [Paramecium pentaurelia]